MNLKVEKSTIGIPRKCLKLAANHIYEALTIVFNNSLQLGIFPDIFKISRVTPVDKGGNDLDQTIKLSSYFYTFSPNTNF